MTTTRDATATGHLLPEPDFDFLEPERLRLTLGPSGTLRMTIEGDRSYPEVKAVRAFPTSEPDRYIGLLTGADRTIGIVVDPDLMDEASRALLAEDLRRRYMVPVIRRIHLMKDLYGTVYCDVETDYGRREFVVRGIRDNVEDLGDGQLLFTDVDGNRYRVVDWRRLDAQSRRPLERLI